MFLNKEQQSRGSEHLGSIIHRYSDADSSILSEYIIALLAKEGSKSTIRDDCQRELSAFMNDKTSEFVSELFGFIERKLFSKDRRYLLCLIETAWMQCNV